jgi:carbamoyl-phosphate synthase large subunit
MVLQLKQAMKEVPSLRNGRILVADRAALTPAGCYADGSFVVPSISHQDYVDRLLDICGQHDVRVVVPLIDLDLERLSPHLARFSAIGTAVVCPPKNLVELCLDKQLMRAFAELNQLATPRGYSHGEIGSAEYPLFHKRRRGFGSIGSGICRSPSEARELLSRDPDVMFEDLITAPEASVDALISSRGDCIVRVPRIRDKVVGGEAVQSHTIDDTPVVQLASKTISALAASGLTGPLNVQMFMTDPPVLIEVNTRLGSASVLSNQATKGFFFRSVLAEACGESSKGNPHEYVVGMQLYRFLGDVIYNEEGLIAQFPPGDRGR